MNKGFGLKMAVLAILALLFSAGNAIAADDVFKFKFDYDSRSVIDSTRRDWHESVYSPESAVPEYRRRQYDKTFVGGRTNMVFQILGDLNETHFLDIKEFFNYRHYNKEELLSRDYSSFKYRELDHLLNVTWGIAAGDHDYFQFDFYNNILDIPELDFISYRSNRGAAQITHEFSQRTCLSLMGNFEERKYDQDLDYNFREARAGFEIVSLLPGRHKYVAVANSTRGDRRYFQNFPNAMSAAKAIDYYTSYDINPRDEDPRARYFKEKTRGDLFVKVIGDMGTRDFVKVGNRSNHVAATVELAYEISQDMTLRLRDTYRKVDYQKESAAYFHHDHSSNYLALAADYDYSTNMFQTITFVHELFNHPYAGQQNYNTGSIVYEGMYEFGRSRASLELSGLQRRYSQNRENYPDNNEWKTGVGYDYLITDTIRFRLKSEFIKSEYLNNQDYLFSGNNRNTWRIAVEKSLSSSNSLEIAFQQNTEKHTEFFQNNFEEKSLHLSWISNF